MVKKLSKEEQFILYALGQCYKVFRKRFNDKPLQVSISKAVFIDLMISSDSVKKKERALYRNLESIEQKGYARYKDKELKFTKKGLQKFKKLDKEIRQYTTLLEHLNHPKTIKLHKKIQTR
jgi:hypothetical protein